jgi:hypothetical protein
MKRTRRFPQRLIRWTSLFVSVALIFTTIILSSPGTIASRKLQQGRERRMAAAPPEPGAPKGVFPNLDEAKRRRNGPPRIAPHVESTVRSRRKPLESRHGLKVGDRLPTATPSPIVMPSPTPASLPSASASNWRRAIQASLDGPVSVEESLNRRHLRALHHDGLQFLNLNFSSTASGRHPTARSVYERSTDLFVPPVPQSGSSTIVYVSNRDGSMQIYVMNADGSGQYRLTSSGANDLYPRWSPDGTKILFESDRDNPTTGYLNMFFQLGMTLAPTTCETTIYCSQISLR